MPLCQSGVTFVDDLRRKCYQANNVPYTHKSTNNVCIIINTRFSFQKEFSEHIQLLKTAIGILCINVLLKKTSVK